MGLRKEEDNTLPPLFTGEALALDFPPIVAIINGPKGKGTKTVTPHTIAFPHWVYTVTIDETSYDILGQDLQTGMAIKIKDGNHVVVSDIKKQLYHGMEEQPVLMLPEAIDVEPIEVGRPRKDTDNIKKYKFDRKFFEDGHIEWKVEEVSSYTNFTK